MSEQTTITPGNTNYVRVEAPKSDTDILKDQVEYLLEENQHQQAWMSKLQDEIKRLEEKVDFWKGEPLDITAALPTQKQVLEGINKLKESIKNNGN